MPPAIGLLREDRHPHGPKPFCGFGERSE